jgi:hypothetical protein
MRSSNVKLNPHVNESTNVFNIIDQADGHSRPLAVKSPRFS